MEQRQSKLLGLEILRFACALAVVIYHFRHFAKLPGAEWLTDDRFPLATLLGPVYYWGQVGVQCFWIISGFVFFWKYGETISSRAITATRFFWLRFSRLYPLHIVTLCAVAAAQPVFAYLTGHYFVYDDNSPTQFVLNLFMATQWGTMAPMSFNGPFWSVSAEVMVYAIFFLLVWLFRSSVALCVAMVVGGILICTFAALPVAICALMFFAGGLTAILFKQFGRQWQAHAAAGCAFVVVAILIWRANLNGTELSPRLLPLILGPQLLFLGAKDFAFLDRFARPIEVAGNLTYSTYMCHFPMQLMLAIVVAATGVLPPLQSPAFLLAYVSAVLVVGYFVFEQFERPAQDAIRNWQRARTAQAA